MKIEEYKKILNTNLSNENLDSFLFDNNIIYSNNKKIKTIIKEINDEFLKIETLYDENEIFEKFKEEVQKMSYQYIEENFYDIITNLNIDKDEENKYDIIIIDGFLDEDITSKKIKLIKK